MVAVPDRRDDSWQMGGVLRSMSWNVVPSSVSAIVGSAHTSALCAPLTLHLNKRKACALGDEHPGCCPQTCKRTAQVALNC